MKPPRILDAGRRWLMLWLALLVLVQAAALAGAAVATRSAFAALHAGDGLPLVVLGALGLAGIVGGLCHFGLQLLAERLGQDYGGAVRAAVFEHASRSAAGDLARRRFGYLLLRFTGDLAALRDWPGQGLPQLLQAVILLPAAAAVLWVLHPPFGWLAAGLTLLSLTAAGIGFPALVAAHDRLRTRRARLAADMAERVPVAPHLAALGRRGTELRVLAERVVTLSDAAVHRRALSGGLGLVPETLAACVACGVLWLGARDGLPPASVAAALAALALTLRPLRSLASSLDQAAAFRIAHAKLARALDRPVTRSSRRGGRLKPGPVELRVTGPDGLALTVAPGSHAQIDPDLLERLSPVLAGVHPPGALCVRLNGKDIRRLSPGCLRRAVGVIGDAPLILKGTLRKNVTLGLRRRPKDSVIEQRAASAGLGAALDRLGGLGRSLSERGADLTAAEKRDLCRLRIALQRPALVVVDSAALCGIDCLGIGDVTMLSASKSR